MAPSRTLLSVLLLFIHVSTILTAAQNNVNIINFGTAIFGANCAVDKLSCKDFGYPSWCCPVGNVCAFDRNGDIVCCPNGMVCGGNLPYLGGSNIGSTSQETVNVLQTSTSTLAPTSVPVTPSTTTNAAMAGPINMGDVTVGPTMNAQLPVPAAVYNKGIRSRTVVATRFITISLGVLAILL